MPRDIYKQPVGNPIQLDQVPQGQLELCFPVRPESEREDLRRTWLTVPGLVVISVTAILTQAVFFGRSPDLHHRILGPTDYLFWGIAVFLAVRRSAMGTMLAIGSALSVYLYLQIPLSLEGQGCLLAVMLGGLTWNFGRHWISLCTASPMDRRTASRLKIPWLSYLSCAALIPITGLLLSRLTESRLLPATAIVCFVAIQVTLAIRQSGTKILPLLAESLQSWLTYGNDRNVPGSLRSPAGTRPLRLVFTGLCVFVAALTCVRWADESMMEHQREHVGEVPVISIPAMLLPSELMVPGHPVGVVLLRLAEVLIALALPAVFVLATPLVLALPVLAQAAKFRQRDFRPRHWKKLIREVQNSPDPVERRSLLMARLVSDGSPLLVPRKIFGEHAHFLGASGAGKTSLGLAPWIEQTFLGEDCSIVVIDLKADTMELYAALHAAAEQRGMDCSRSISIRHVSNQARNTFGFNPLRQSYWKDLDDYTKTDILCGALGLTYGSDYGEGYYGSANSAVLYHAIRTFPDVDTFRDLADRVGYVAGNASKTELHPEIRKSGIHVHEVLKRLAAFEALNVAPNGAYSDEVVARSIDLQSVFTQPELCYFHLSATLGPGSSPEIARLVTYSLLTAATQTERRVPVYLVIDEFQRMVAHNVEYMLQLARSMGVGVILANQSMEDLKSSKTDLINAVEANCHYRQWFTVPTSKDRQRVIIGSGETCDEVVTRSQSRNNQGGMTQGVSRQEWITPRFPMNQLLQVNSNPQQSIVDVSRGDGYALYGGLPIIVESDYHITEDEYDIRKSMAWPESIPGSFVPGTGGPTGSTPAVASGTHKAAGPVISTQVIGGKSQSQGTKWANPFASLASSSSQSQTKPKSGQGKKP